MPTTASNIASATCGASRDGDLIGDLSVSSGLVGAHDVDGVLSEGSFNFSSVPARAQRAKLIAQAARTNGKINFLQQLEEVCKLTTVAGAARPAGRDSPERRARGARRPLRRRGLEVSQAASDDPVRPGGTMKSYLALWALGRLAIAGVRVGFVDWELDDSRPQPARCADPRHQSAGDSLPPGGTAAHLRTAAHPAVEARARLVLSRAGLSRVRHRRQTRRRRKRDGLQPGVSRARLRRARDCAHPEGRPEPRGGREVSVRLASSGTTPRAAPGSSRTPRARSATAAPRRSACSIAR